MEKSIPGLVSLGRLRTYLSYGEKLPRSGLKRTHKHVLTELNTGIVRLLA